MNRLVLVISVMLSTSAWSGVYPPDYPNGCNAVTDASSGPFRIHKKKYNYSAGKYYKVHILYTGKLRENHSDSEIDITVTLNNKTQTFRASPGYYNDAYLLLNASQHSCRLIGGTSWECKRPTTEEADLFFYSSTQFGYENAWDMSFKASVGDEVDEGDYKVRLEPKSCF